MHLGTSPRIVFNNGIVTTKLPTFALQSTVILGFSPMYSPSYLSIARFYLSSHTFRRHEAIRTPIYIPQELGGYGRCIYDFVNSLTDLSHHVDVLTSDAPYLLPDDQTANTQNELIDSHISGSQAQGLLSKRCIINHLPC